jgi:hypothetical protein
MGGIVLHLKVKKPATDIDAVVEEMSLEGHCLVPQAAAPGSEDQFSAARSPASRILTLLWIRV